MGAAKCRLLSGQLAAQQERAAELKCELHVQSHKARGFELQVKQCEEETRKLYESVLRAEKTAERLRAVEEEVEEEMMATQRSGEGSGRSQGSARDQDAHALCAHAPQQQGWLV